MKIPYTSLRGGKRFFEPRGRMVEAGFRPKSLGLDDEAARREAWRLYEDWMQTRDGRAPAPAESASGRATKETISLGKRYPRGSIGAAWQEWIRTAEWSALALSNRTKIWWPAWEKRIEPVFGDVRPDTISMKQMSEWRETVAREFGVDAAHKAMKVWRALWGVLQALRYTQLTDPSKKVTNTAPKPRSVRHEFAPALHLAKTAWRKGYRGLACIIIVCWDAGFQPGDARTARAKHLGEDPQNRRLILDRSVDGRSKTEVAVIGTLSRLGDAMVRTYLKELGVELMGEALLFRTRTKQPYRDTVLSHDFADIRAMVDPEDRHQLRDMRRSATTEAFRGGADSKAVSQKFGNSIDRSAFLFKTYNPVDLEQVRQADEARVRGRRKRNST
ncbi:MAG: hypothetical protein ACRYGP_09950 [Janthinobacterium lividum]